MEISAPADNASMNCLVPDLAMVPRLFTKSDFVKPIPVSWMTKVLFALSGIMEILRSFSESRTDASERELYRILSRASEALEINSRRKTAVPLVFVCSISKTMVTPEHTLLVRVDGVNDEREKLRDFSLELECLNHRICILI